MGIDMNQNLSNNEYLTVKDVQKYLNISQSKAYELVHRKDFPVCRFGACTRVPRKLFLAWAEKHTKVPTDLVVA